VPQLYTVPLGPWERFTTPAGEVLACTACEYPVQMVFAVGPVQPSASPWATNEVFLRNVASAAEQERTARCLVASDGEASVASGGMLITIVRTGIGELAGLPALEYEATVTIRGRTLRQSGAVVVHWNRLLRIAVLRTDGPVCAKEREAVSALRSGIRLATD